jgi:hypothetical protein
LFFARTYDARIDYLVISPRASHRFAQELSGHRRIPTLVNSPRPIDDYPGDAGDLCRRLIPSFAKLLTVTGDLLIRGDQKATLNPCSRQNH